MLPLSVMIVGFPKLTKLFLMMLAKSSDTFQSTSLPGPSSFLNQDVVLKNFIHWVLLYFDFICFGFFLYQSPKKLALTK